MKRLFSTSSRFWWKSVLSGAFRLRKSRLLGCSGGPPYPRYLILRQAYGIKPPYNEDTCILVPAAKCFADFESYMGAFDLLQAAGVLHPEDILLDVTVLIEDENTLAYIV